MTDQAELSGTLDSASGAGMAPRRLAFGPFRLRRLGQRFLVLQTEAGAHIELAQVEALHRALAMMVPEQGFVLLVDKRTRYSLSFEAQRILYKVPRLMAVALVLESAAQLPAVRSTLVVGKEHAHCKIQVYYALQPALRWLRSVLQQQPT